jgi:hypothetical protein
VPPAYRAWANALSAGVKIFMPAGAKTIYAPHVEHVHLISRRRFFGLRTAWQLEVCVRVAGGPPQRIRDKGQQHLPGDEVWLIGEHRTSGEKKYWADPGRACIDCAHDDDRLRLPPGLSAQNRNGPTPAPSLACRATGHPRPHRSTTAAAMARTAGNGFATRCGVSKSAKVVLSPWRQKNT